MELHEHIQDFIYVQLIICGLTIEPEFPRSLQFTQSSLVLDYLLFFNHPFSFPPSITTDSLELAVYKISKLSNTSSQINDTFTDIKN
jgi:hypothetical protein